jgi:cytochrome c-type biogenesis protein CcmE
MEGRRERLQRLRVASLLAAIIVGLGLLLTQCPSNRDGMPGQLAQSMDETTTAARSGALALDLWIQRRSTNQLASVQLSDAREQVVEAYKGITDMRAEDQVDIGRQRMLTESMTAIIGELNAAAATIRHVTTDPTAEKARDDLLASADALESGYR